MTKLKKSLRRLQQEAKSLSRETGISHRKALDEIARRYHFPNWDAARQAEVESPPEKNSDPDLGNSPSKAVSKSNKIVARQFDPHSNKPNATKNQDYFASLGVDFSIFEPTATGLKKSILDATIPVRSHLNNENFHSFAQQGQGIEHKVIKTAFFVTPEKITKTKVSLYRPTTKNGDPRMWFSGLGNFADAGDKISIVILHNLIYLFNFSQISPHHISESLEINELIRNYLQESGSVANELLGKLKTLAQRLIPATVNADTAIGRAVETALGIDINSSKQPDYKGIEIKTGRMDSKNRSTLFAQVADWSISNCKSSAEILNKYGYPRENDFKLYCTVSAQKPNSQGLQFLYDDKKDQLIEKHKNGEIVAIWPGQVLRDRLIEKHAETFWITARSTTINGVEHFQLDRVIHTKKPIQAQLMPLIESGIITMDHLIKRKTTNTGKQKTSEKGPLFKIDAKNLELLFPKNTTYKLISDN